MKQMLFAYSNVCYCRIATGVQGQPSRRGQLDRVGFLCMRIGLFRNKCRTHIVMCQSCASGGQKRDLPPLGAAVKMIVYWLHGVSIRRTLPYQGPAYRPKQLDSADHRYPNSKQERTGERARGRN